MFYDLYVIFCVLFLWHKEREKGFFRLLRKKVESVEWRVESGVEFRES